MILLAVGIFVGCGESSRETDSATAPSNGAAAESYRLLQAELLLADAEIPYFVFDLSNRELQIRLRGTVVWNESLRSADADSLQFVDFAAAWSDSGQTVVRYLQEKRLTVGQKRHSDSVLAIVSNILRIDPQLLQRDLPVDFELRWESGFRCRFVAIEDSLQAARATGTLDRVRGSLEFRHQERALMLHIPIERALTLYRVAHPGIPTLVSRF